MTTATEPTRSERPARELLAEVRALGVELRSVAGGEVRARPASKLPARLRAELRARQRELCGLLLFGDGPAALLYPLLGRRVSTPMGSGVLLQSFARRASVALDSRPDVCAFFLPEDVRPLESPK